MDIRYLNTDLELESTQDLTPIVDCFGDKLINLYNGKRLEHYLATFEVADITENPDLTINSLCTLIEELEPSTRKLWDQCFLKVFDIGYEGGTNHKSYTSEIKNETLKRISELGANMRITVYPMNNHSGE